jgi:hypothetical protein
MKNALKLDYVDIVLNFVKTASISKFIAAVLSIMEPADQVIGGSEMWPSEYSVFS